MKDLQDDDVIEFAHILFMTFVAAFV